MEHKRPPVEVKYSKENSLDNLAIYINMDVQTENHDIHYIYNVIFNYPVFLKLENNYPPVHQ